MMAMLSLTHRQARCLQNALQSYRHYAFTSLPPCAERNATLRTLQTIQGQLTLALDHREKPLLPLTLTSQERATLQSMLASFLVLTADLPACSERDARLVDLAAFQAALKKM